MISAIDRTIIEIFQWVIRQIELFTSITKKYCMFAMLSLLSMIQLYLTLYYLGRFDILMYIFVVNPLTIKTVSVIAAYNKKETAGTLPRAIKERAKKRIVFTFLFFILLCLLFIPTFSYLYFSGTFFSNTLTARLLYFFVSCTLITCIEYLLCTSFLPPGEKAKRKMEKELRRALPNGA